jgi:hypothetical protein
VLMGLVDHVQAFGRESLGQLLRDQIEGSHVLPLSGSQATRSMPKRGLCGACVNTLVKT